MSIFWQQLAKPFLVLAPMDDVTDVVFREVVAGLPRPDVFVTEFTSADGLMSKGGEVTSRKLKYTETQRPVVAQIWGIHPDNLYKAAKLVRELKFDGIDINMGCPDKSVMKHGAGGALATNPDLAKQVIEAVKQGAPDLPLSIKTRLGYNKIVTDEWISFLLEQKLDALAVHGRVATQMSKGEANWEEIGKAVKIRDRIAPETVLIGNGDIKTYHQAIEMHKMHGVDGVMIGRGIFSNPWVFERTNEPKLRDRQEYIDILLKHLKLFDETWGGNKHFDIMKKFFKMYVKDFDGANQLRQRLMECKNSSEVMDTLDKL